MSLRAVLFDLDYTLYDQRPFLEGALRDVARAHAAATGQPAATLEEGLVALWRRLGTRHPGLFDAWGQELGVAMDVPGCVRTFHAHRPARLQFYPGVAESLGALRGQGLKLGIVTDGDVTMQRTKVETLGVGALVDVVVFTKAIGAPKPSPRGILHALEQLAIPPAHAAYIGDHPELDMGAARAAGVRAVRVMTGEHARLPALPGLPPDLVAASLAEALASLGLATTAASASRPS